MNQEISLFAVVAPVFIITLISGLLWFHDYTGLGRGKSFLALLGSLLIPGIFCARSFLARQHARDFFNQHPRENLNFPETYLTIIAAGLVYPLLAAFVFRLWGRWIGDKATDAERRPGVEGIRAWFCASNVTVGTLIVICLWLGYDISPVLSAVIVAALLAVYPILAMESPALAASIASAPAAGEDLSAEREKILSMLETGKLTAEESAELLQALGESSRAPSRQVPLTGHQRLMLIGAALVALGFFLPWVVVNPGKGVDQAMQQMLSTFHSRYNSSGLIPDILPSADSQFVNTPSMSFSGGDLRSLGWATLVLALAAALLPYVATALDTHTARTVRLLCLGLGSLIVLYLLTQNLRFVGIGLIIAVAGYALEIVGAIRERRAVSA